VRGGRTAVVAEEGAVLTTPPALDGGCGCTLGAGDAGGREGGRVLVHPAGGGLGAGGVVGAGVGGGGVV
jgi:hypothetical protein